LQYGINPPAGINLSWRATVFYKEVSLKNRTGKDQTDVTGSGRPDLVFRWLSDFSGFLVVDAVNGLRWELDRKCGTPKLSAVDRFSKTIGEVFVSILWPVSKSAFSCRHISFLLSSAAGISQKEYKVFISGATEFARRCALLEKKLPEYFAMLFPRMESGVVDWKRCPVAGLDKVNESGAYLKMEHLFCGLYCIFCTRSVGKSNHTPPLFSTMNKLYEAAITLPMAGKGVSFKIGGDEPARHPDLPSLVALGRARGYKKIVLQTSDMELFESAPRFAALIREGLTQVQVPIYGTTGGVHDAVVGVEGHFSKTVKAMKFLKTMPVEVEVHTLVLKQNMHECAGLPAFVEKLGHRFEEIRMPRYEGPSREPPQVWMPRLSEVHLELKTMISPLKIPCLGIGKIKNPVEDIIDRSIEVAGTRNLKVVESMNLVYSNRCRGCTDLKNCSGVFPGYIEVYGDDEFVPRMKGRKARKSRLSVED